MTSIEHLTNIATITPAPEKQYCEMSCGRRAAFLAQRFDEGGAKHACGGHLAAAVRAVSPDKPVMVTALAAGAR
ncbi:hypothetical protein [Amycolatopsis sp. NBC_01480]|uniref:hypothetical protein n=1 Tax=Amycolatopsis sp. NBC_01480 TaxID=2903562 RepID=UPI002E2E4E57|nr:hypothetical protein [Amycolatopsis sp. NBC_01480]